MLLQGEGPAVAVSSIPYRRYARKKHTPARALAHTHPVKHVSNMWPVLVCVCVACVWCVCVSYACGARARSGIGFRGTYVSSQRRVVMLCCASSHHHHKHRPLHTARTAGCEASKHTHTHVPKAAAQLHTNEHNAILSAGANTHPTAHTHGTQDARKQTHAYAHGEKRTR